MGSFGIALPLVLYGWFTLRPVARRKEKGILSPEEEEFDHQKDDEEHVADNRETRTCPRERLMTNSRPFSRSLVHQSPFQLRSPLA